MTGTKNTDPRANGDYRALPKVELHRHLEGSLRLDTIYEIARTYDLDVPYDDPPRLRQLVQVLPGDTYDYKNFLSKFKTLRKFYLNPAIIQRITREAVLDAAADNIRYLELRFTPVALGVISRLEPPEVIDLVIEAAHAAEEEAGIRTRLIVSMNRHESVTLAESVTAAALDRKDDGVVGLDLAGDEVNFSALPFAALFREARAGGLRLTVHAGEWGGPENVVEAIEALGAERIGHGVRVCEDPAAVALTAERGIPFEVCPTSNYQTGVFNSLPEHNLPAMLKAGLKVTLNTDDPGISAINLSDEYAAALLVLGSSLAQVRTMTLNAAESAFLPPDHKQALIAQIIQAFDQETETDHEPF